MTRVKTRWDHDPILGKKKEVLERNEMNRRSPYCSGDFLFETEMMGLMRVMTSPHLTEVGVRWVAAVVRVRVKSRISKVVAKK